MRQSKFYKISDKIFTVVTCAMVIMFVLCLIVDIWSFGGTFPEIKFIRVFFSEQVIWAFVVITILAQLLFIVSHVKRYKGNPGGKFLIGVLFFNLVLEAPAVWFLSLHNLEPMVFLWVAPVFILAELTQKDFEKGIDKIFAAVTWVMAVGSVFSIIAVIVLLLKEKTNFSVWYSFVFPNSPIIQILSGVIVFAQISFVLTHWNEIKREDSRKLLIALILNTFLVILLVSVLIHSPLNIFYLCATPLLVYAKTAAKKVLKQHNS